MSPDDSNDLQRHVSRREAIVAAMDLSHATLSEDLADLVALLIEGEPPANDSSARRCVFVAIERGEILATARGHGRGATISAPRADETSMAQVTTKRRRRGALF